MSAQLSIAQSGIPPKTKRTKPKQIGIAGFCKNVNKTKDYTVHETNLGLVQCSYNNCWVSSDKWFTPQGFATHQKTHVNRGHVKKKSTTKYGPVKYRDGLPPPSSTIEIDCNGEEEEDNITNTGGNTNTNNNEGGITESNIGNVSHVGRTDINITNTGGDTNANNNEGAGATESNISNVSDSTNKGVAESIDDDKVSSGTKRKRKRQYKPHEVVELLDDWYTAGLSKKKFCKERGIDKKQLKRWIENEQKHREAATIKSTSVRISQAVVNESVGEYPAMEYELAVNLRVMRDCGLTISSWMLEYEGKMAFHKLDPQLHPEPTLDGADEHQYPLKFSDTWKRNFMKRHGFSFRKVGTRMNKKGVTNDMVEKIREFHLRCRELQLSKIVDPIYGAVHPHYVISHDQVPMEILDKNETTIEVKGVSYLPIHLLGCPFACLLNI